MRITKKQLDEAAEMLSRNTGKDYKVVPFPAPGPNGYNLVVMGRNDYDTVKGGRPARELWEWIHAYCLGYREGRDTAQRSVETKVKRD